MTVVAMDVSAEPADGVDEQLVRQLAARARSEGLKLTGEGGLLARLTKVVVESALEGEMDDHLGYGKHDPTGRNGGNSRNGTRSKTLVTEAGPVQIEGPRDRESSFEPMIVAKRGTEGFGTKSGARACFCWSKGLLPDVQYDGRFGQPGNPTRP